MRAYFESFGEVKDALVKFDANTGASRGFGFVIFSNEASIEAVFASGSHEIDGKKVILILTFKVDFDTCLFLGRPEEGRASRWEDVCRRCQTGDD